MATVETPRSRLSVQTVHPPRSKRSVRGWVRRGGIGALLFSLPLIIVFGLFAWWPLLRSLPLSVQKTNLVTEPTFVWFDNFARVLADPLLGTAILNTTWYVVLGVVFGFPLPILLAASIRELRRLRGLASVLVYLPVILPPVVSVLLWKQLYNPEPTGLLNTVVGWFGIGPLPWLQSAETAMPSLVIHAIWSGCGGAVVIYLAALVAVPGELYEAAELDGAGVFRRAWHITIPQLRRVILLMLLLQVIGTFQVFTEPFVMTGGGPNNSTLTVLMLVFRYAFGGASDFGKASALSLLLALFLALLSFVYVRLSRRWAE